MQVIRKGDRLESWGGAGLDASTDSAVNAMTAPHYPTAWHITSGEIYEVIAADGHLRPTDLGIQSPELPVLWFSLDQYVDRSARKVIAHGDVFRILSVQDTRVLGGGLIRLGIDARQLLHGSALRKGAKISWPRWFAIRKAGIKRQADPDFWLGTVNSIPIAEMTIDVMNNGGVWVRVQDGIK